MRVDSGLSPRVRGSHREAPIVCTCCGPIPACAGEPGFSLRKIMRQRAYPRVCGGAFSRNAAAERPEGLSPRVRGSPLEQAFVHAPRGPIPACAGEPRQARRASARIRAYPRVCGGASASAASISSYSGLSPRVRGSLPMDEGASIRTGPIPACAGEPMWPCEFAQPFRAYPRECGGAGGAGLMAKLYAGLSPRVRGSHLPT